MATVSLLTVGQALGRTSGQQVKLGSLRDNGYTRTDAGSGYLRVNPFQVEDGNADDPARGDSLHYLGNWVAYDHDHFNGGSNLEVTNGYGEVTLAWAKPAGYSRAEAILDQKIWVKATGYTGDTPGETQTSTNPFDTPDQTQLAGDALTDDVNLASYPGEWVAIGIAPTFDDSVTVHEGGAGNGDYSAKAGETPLTGAGAGILVRAYDEQPPTCSVTQITDPDSCYVGNNVTLRISVGMEGPSTGRLEESTNGGSSWSLVDSSVTAGTANIDVSRASGGPNYKFRIRYNDVSPDTWRTQTGTTTPTCNLI